jgi:hypothetical protein
MYLIKTEKKKTIKKTLGYRYRDFMHYVLYFLWQHLLKAQDFVMVLLFLKMDAKFKKKFFSVFFLYRIENTNLKKLRCSRTFININFKTLIKKIFK